jgi:uncharacterized protein YndB with AHSA1/START domain
VSATYRTSIAIAAPPDRVFDYFVVPELLVRWMGDWAQLEARDGGLFAVDINGVVIRGRFLRVERPHLVEIAWGEAGNEAMPPGSTRLLVRFTATDEGTLVELEHDGLVPDEATKHATGWPHFLDRLRVLGGGGDPGPDPWSVQSEASRASMVQRAAALHAADSMRGPMPKHKYLVLFRNRPTAGAQPAPSPERMQQMFAAYNEWKERFKEEILDMGDKLASAGRVVTASGVADGPFVEAKEIVGGYMIVSASDFDRAVEVVRACPAIHVPGASLEIRELAGAKM